LKLDPVFVLGPEKPVQPSRRGFLAAGCALGLGLAIGYGIAGRRDPKETLAGPDLPASDPDLVWARTLAAGDLDALVAASTGFVTLFHTAPGDPELQRGLVRLAAFVTEQPAHDRSPRLARTILAAVDRFGLRVDAIDSLRSRLESVGRPR
jgi:hypothetical protein